MALDIIAQAGPGGNYLELDHTFEHMRDTAVLPTVATREMRGKWEEAGRPDATARAIEVASTILKKDNPAVFSQELDKRIRARFSDLISGDAKWTARP